MGGLAWFAIPMLAATSMGLAALCLESDPSWPTYPYRMAASDVSAGLVLPEAAVALLGRGGAVASLLLVFMAVTSAMSAQLIAVSSIATYDIYQTYINPQASGKRLIWVSHGACVAWALIMASVATGFYYGGISMGYLYLLMGVIISGAVIPAACTLMWTRQSWAAATFSPPFALACSLSAWLATTKTEFGYFNVDSTGSNNPMLVGNVVSLLTPLITVPVLSLIFRNEPYDWKSMAAIRRGDDSDLAKEAHMDLEAIPGEHHNSAEEEAAEKRALERASKIARALTGFLAIALLVLWPMPMYGSGYIFSKKFFIGWIVVGIIWLFCSAFTVGLYPLWEGRKTMARTFKAIFRDVTGGRPQIGGRVGSTEEVSETVSDKEGEKTPQ